MKSGVNRRYIIMDYVGAAGSTIMAEKETIAAAAEAEIIREIEELIRKLAAGQASPQEIQLLQDLQKRRVELMRPSVIAMPERIPA